MSVKKSKETTYCSFFESINKVFMDLSSINKKKKRKKKGKKKKRKYQKRLIKIYKN